MVNGIIYPTAILLCLKLHSYFKAYLQAKLAFVVKKKGEMYGLFILDREERDKEDKMGDLQVTNTMELDLLDKKIRRLVFKLKKVSCGQLVRMMVVTVSGGKM